MFRRQKPIGLGTLCFILGIFAALVLPLWLIAALEGAIIIFFGCWCIRR
ncbi:MAG: hypothetical protein Q4C12_03275 [Clostridia bacterium]|nr:hypothetical protein [Clostridia bacterium]